MSYVVRARKYRPRTFAQMVGQEHVVQALTNALQQQRLHHAYLFTGTRGIGKTTVSRILAKSLNCTGADGQGGITAEPCGVCQACTEIDADRYIDYIELDAASNRSIDEIRDLIERAAYKPSLGRFKVFMIDEAHQLTKDAFNALLKTLEEPPDYLKFVLATTDPEKMLPTVLSRCLQFNLRPMAPEVVQDHLQRVLDAEGVAADAGALRLLARAARGSMRDGLSLADQAIAYGAGRLDEAGVRAMLGSVDRSLAAGVVQSLARRDGAAVLAAVDSLRAMGQSAAGMLEELAMLLQQMAIEQAVPGALDDNDPDTAAARQLAAQMPADETQLLYSIALHGRAELGLISDEYAALTMVLLRLLAFPPAAGAAAAPAARAAPLVASAPVARSSAPARPAAGSPQRNAVPLPGQAPARVAAGAGATAQAGSGSAAPVAGDSAAQRPMAAPATARSSAAAAAGPAPTDSARSGPRGDTMQPPPWIDDEVPDLGDDQGPGGSARAEAGAPQADDAPPPVARGRPAATSTVPTATTAPRRVPTAMGQLWFDTLRPLVARGVVAALVRELALQAELLDVQPLPEGGRRWRLRVERETLRAPPLAVKLAAALQAALGEPVQLDIEPGAAQDSIARRNAAAREAAQQEAEAIIHADPAVRELMAQFRTARIIPGSIKPLGSDAADPADTPEARTPPP